MNSCMVTHMSHTLEVMFIPISVQSLKPIWGDRQRLVIQPKAWSLGMGYVQGPWPELFVPWGREF